MENTQKIFDRIEEFSVDLNNIISINISSKIFKDLFEEHDEYSNEDNLSDINEGLTT